MSQTPYENGHNSGGINVSGLQCLLVSAWQLFIPILRDAEF